MTYEEALLSLRRTGIAHARGLPHLAMTVQTLASIHAIVPALVYEGARKRGLSSKELLSLPPHELADLMFT